MTSFVPFRNTLKKAPGHTTFAACSLSQCWYCEEEVREALFGLHNGRAKGVQGLPSELLRYAKLEPDPEKPPSVNVLAPVLAVVLNAAFHVGLKP